MDMGSNLKPSLLQQFAQNCRPNADTISQFSMESTTSVDSKEPIYFAAMDIRKRLTENVVAPKTKFQVQCETKNLRHMKYHLSIVIVSP